MKTNKNPSSFLSVLREHIVQIEAPVILLEGTRDVPPDREPVLIRLGAMLAKEFSHALFRSGNAPGSDTLFARGVESVDPERMQIVTPTAGHRKKNIHPSSYVVPLSKISAVNEESIAYHTTAASPVNHRLIEKRNEVSQLKAKANYLLRDTLKVLGDPENELAPANAAIFYTKPDPMSGGTGHTIRVCRQHNVPVFLQADWLTWICENLV
jgi:hypothetical protein